MRVGTEIFGKIGVQFSDKKWSPIFFKPWLVGCSKMLADVPLVQRGILCKTELDRTEEIIHVWGASSKNVDYAVEGDSASFTLFSVLKVERTPSAVLS